MTFQHPIPIVSDCWNLWFQQHKKDPMKKRGVCIISKVQFEKASFFSSFFFFSTPVMCLNSAIPQAVILFAQKSQVRRLNDSSDLLKVRGNHVAGARGGPRFCFAFRTFVQAFIKYLQKFCTLSVPQRYKFLANQRILSGLMWEFDPVLLMTKKFQQCLACFSL